MKKFVTSVLKSHVDVVLIYPFFVMSLFLFKVMRFRSMVTQHTIHLSFTEHQKCDCR